MNLQTNYSRSMDFTLLKPVGKKERRARRQMMRLFFGRSVPRSRLRKSSPNRFYEVRFIKEGHVHSMSGTVEQIRPIANSFGKYRLPGDEPLIRKGRKP